MTVAWNCACGRSLQITPSAVQRRVGCPFCGAVTLIPAAPARPGLSPWLIGAALTALLATGTIVAVVATRKPPPVEQEQARKDPLVVKEQPVEKEPPRKTVVAAIPDGEKPVVGPGTGRLEVPAKPPEKEPASTKPPEKEPTPAKPPEKKPANPVLEVVKVEPAEPKEGERLTVLTKLSHPDGGTVRLEYRLGGEESWKAATGDRVELPKVTGPLLALEMRAVDKAGKTSAIERRTWTVTGPTTKPMTKPVTGTIVRLEWKLRKGDAFLQELTISQKPTFTVADITVQSPLQYTVVSRFTVEEATADGYVVVQKIEKAQLTQADELTQGALGPAVKKLPGTKFKIHLDPKLEIKKFEGADAKLQFGSRALPGGMGLQAASLMDRDGWKEMAQAVFFRPLDEVSPRTYWSRPMSHNWGPLGSWTGQTLFVYAGRQGNLHQFNYGHRMAHVAPRGGGGGLPFQVMGASFVPLEAVGQLIFDSGQGRVVGGQERFRVRGKVSITVLGMQTPVDVEEEQTFQFRVVPVSP